MKLGQNILSLMLMLCLSALSAASIQRWNASVTEIDLNVFSGLDEDALSSNVWDMSGQPYLYDGKERMRDNGLNESSEYPYQVLTSQPRLIQVKKIKDRLGNIKSIIGVYNNQDIFISGLIINESPISSNNEIEIYSFYLFELEEDRDYNRFRDVLNRCIDYDYRTYIDYLPHFKAKNIINGK